MAGDVSGGLLGKRGGVEVARQRLGHRGLTRGEGGRWAHTLRRDLMESGSSTRRRYQICASEKRSLARILEVRPKQTTRRGGGGGGCVRNTDWRIK